MKIVRKIKFKRAKELSGFKKIENKFLIWKNDSTLIKNISDLNFFLVLDFVSYLEEKLDLNKIFTQSSSKNNNFIVDFDAFIREQQKLKNHINKTRNKNPDFFQKIDFLNEVKGCYLVASTIKNLKQIELLNLSSKNNSNSIFVKLDFKKRPIEFEKMCIAFNKKQASFFEKENLELENFIKFDITDQNLDIQKSLNIISNNICDMINQSFGSSSNTIQIAAENKISEIQNLDFLKSMLSYAEDTENYELCIKIRDRILELQSA